MKPRSRSCIRRSADEHAERARVEEGDAAQVDDEEVDARVMSERVQLLAQLGRDVRVELADRRHHDGATIRSTVAIRRTEAAVPAPPTGDVKLRQRPEADATTTGLADLARADPRLRRNDGLDATRQN